DEGEVHPDWHPEDLYTTSRAVVSIWRSAVNIVLCRRWSQRSHLGSIVTRVLRLWHGCRLGLRDGFGEICGHELDVVGPVGHSLMPIRPDHLPVENKEHARHLKTIPHKAPRAVPIDYSGAK